MVQKTWRYSRWHVAEVQKCCRESRPRTSGVEILSRASSDEIHTWNQFLNFKLKFQITIISTLHEGAIQIKCDTLFWWQKCHMTLVCYVKLWFKACGSKRSCSITCLGFNRKCLSNSFQSIKNSLFWKFIIKSEFQKGAKSVNYYLKLYEIIKYINKISLIFAQEYSQNYFVILG